ncbi:MAG: universal stress protein [Acidobacteriota bacterium]
MKKARALLVDDPSIGNEEAIARLGSLDDIGEVRVLVAPGDVPSLDIETDVDIKELFMKEQHRRADDLVDALRRHGVEASAAVRIGVRPVEIIREVNDFGADFVVKVSQGPHDRESTARSTDAQLIRQCPCPVWITRPREHATYRRVFAAVDPQDEALGRDAGLDSRILDWAIQICRADRAELTVVHVWDMADEGLLLGWGHKPSEEVERLVAQTEASQMRRVRELLDGHDLSGLEHDIQLVKGQPANVLPATLYRGRADLLVMGTVARTGIAGFFIGNTAERVIPQLGCAIFAIKPEGFESPVSPR